MAEPKCVDVRRFLEGFEQRDLTGRGVLNTKKLLLNGNSVGPLLQLMREAGVERLERGDWYLTVDGVFRNPKALDAVYREGKHDITSVSRKGVVFDKQNPIINPHYGAILQRPVMRDYSFDPDGGNLRQFAGYADFVDINREARNLVAILFHALNLRDNLQRFLDVCDCTGAGVGPDTAVYVEFAGVRDLWNTFSNDVERRAAVLGLLQPNDSEALKGCSVAAFNRRFGGGATSQIQSPGGWNLEKMESNIPDNEEFRRACVFKWAFNAKPDLVVQVDHERCLCVEAKLESGIGTYPSKSSEKKVFARRGLDPVSQTEVQRYMMVELLGFKSDFVLLGPAPFGSGDQFVSWGDAFRSLEMGEVPEYMLRTVEAMTSFCRKDKQR